MILNNNFYHTLSPLVAEIYNRINTSQKLQKEVKFFFDKYDEFDSLVGDKVPVTSNTKESEILSTWHGINIISRLF